MNQIKTLPARAARTTLRANRLRTATPIRFLSSTRQTRLTSLPLTSSSARSFLPSALSSAGRSRTYASKSSADELIEQIQDQYATARDEFEIATEETDKKTVYAADDRAAAREELDALKVMYEQALQGSDGEEVKGRIGQRIRELDSAVQALEKRAIEED